MEETLYCEHGVFLSVYDVGLLIKGKPGIGKSTLALELIEKGHDLVSDDIVHITLDKDPGSPGGRLVGKCPHILEDLLAIRDLGVMRISELYPDAKCPASCPVDLIIELVDRKQTLPVLLSGVQSFTSILGKNVPTQLIHAGPERNLALIVETAVKNYILYKNQNNALRILEQRQQEHIKNNQ